MVDTVGHTGGPQQIPPGNNAGGPQPQSGLKAIGQKIVNFFSDLGAAIKNVFSSIGKQAAQQPAHDAGPVPTEVKVHVPKDNLSTSDKKEMMAAFKKSEFRNTMPGGAMNLTTHQLDTFAEEILSRPEATKAMAKHGVSLEEAVSIHIYTGDFYKQINPALWGGKPMTDDVQLCVDKLKDGLAKLPSARPEGERVKHGARQMTEEIMAKYQPGDQITEQACYSTADQIPATFKGNYEFIIVAKDGSAGKEVHMFSMNDDEGEILFPPGSKFDVIGRQVADAPMWYGAPMNFKDSTDMPVGNQQCRVVMMEV